MPWLPVPPVTALAPAASRPNITGAMIAFAELLERLVFTPARNAKIALLRRYFATQPDPDRGIGLAAITGELAFTAAKPGLIRELAAARTDPVLFAWSYDYVGDLAETVALMWPAAPHQRRAAASGRRGRGAGIRAEIRPARPGRRLAGCLRPVHPLRPAEADHRRAARRRLRPAGEDRPGGDRRRRCRRGRGSLARPRTALPPLFAWLEGRAPPPDPADQPVFRPPMLAHPLEPADIAALHPDAWRAEWKWDGIRVQLVATAGGRRLYSRGAEDISPAFPEILEAMDFHAVLDGELLVMREGRVAPFADLQQRLNRKGVTAKMMQEFPVGIRLYDLLFEGHDDVRPLPFDARRARLEAWYERTRPVRMDLSELIRFRSLDELMVLRDGARAASIEGLMLKRADAPYLPGRVKGQWWKWKRDPLNVDAVLMYAQRGHGKRSSFYSDYTFGVWRGNGAGEDELVPVGKAYFGFTDEELAFLDRWIRNHTVARFGPVREVEKALVLEVAFDAAQLSNRHKSGVALRFPRIARIRTDKQAAEADRLETLMALVENRPLVADVE